TTRAATRPYPPRSAADRDCAAQKGSAARHWRAGSSSSGTRRVTVRQLARRLAVGVAAGPVGWVPHVCPVRLSRGPASRPQARVGRRGLLHYLADFLGACHHEREPQLAAWSDCHLLRAPRGGRGGRHGPCASAAPPCLRTAIGRRCPAKV